MLGGFTKVRWLAQLASRQYYRLAVHSCYQRRALPLVVLNIGAEAERSRGNSGAGVRLLHSDVWAALVWAEALPNLLSSAGLAQENPVQPA